jgi:hypothetical protein
MKTDHSQRDNNPNQVFSQIALPFTMVIILVAVGGYLLFSNLAAGTADYRMSSDISVIIIFLPLILSMPLLLIVIILLMALVTAVQDQIKGIFKKISPMLINLLEGTTNITQLFTRPLIAIRTGLSIFEGKKKK